MFKLEKISKIPIVFSIFLLLIGVFISSDDESLGFYTFLRLSVSVTFIYLSMYFFSNKRFIWGWGAIFSFLLFNPFVPVNLEEDTWRAWDIFYVIVLGVIILPDALKSRISLFVSRYWFRVLIVVVSVFGAIILINFLLAKQNEAKEVRLKQIEFERQEVARKETKRKILAENKEYCAGLPVIDAVSGVAQGLDEVRREDIIRLQSACVVFPREMSAKDREDVLLNKFITDALQYDDGKIHVELAKVERRGDQIFIHVSFESVLENKIVWMDTGLADMKDNFGNYYSFDIFSPFPGPDADYLKKFDTFKAGKWRYKDKGTKVLILNDLPIDKASEFIMTMYFKYDNKNDYVKFKFRRSFILGIDSN